MRVFSSLTEELRDSQRRALLRGNAVIAGVMCYTIHTYEACQESNDTSRVGR
jgi:hypothetical protein